MSIITKKLLFKGNKARPEVMKQGVRSELGTFVYDLGVVASTPVDKNITIGASKFYLHRTLIEYPETSVSLGTGAYQTTAFPVGLIKRVLFTINESGTLAMYQGTAVVPPAVPPDPVLPQKERPVCLITVTSAINSPGGIQSIAQADIIQLNLSDWRNSTLVVANYADLSNLAVPQAGDLAYVLDRNELYFYNADITAWRRVGNAQNGRVSLPADSSSITVTFSQPMRTINYVAVPCFYNDTDTYVQYQPITIVSQTVNGFTASWNCPTDTANYKLQYVTSIYE